MWVCTNWKKKHEAMKLKQEHLCGWCDKGKNIIAATLRCCFLVPVKGDWQQVMFFRQFTTTNADENGNSLPTRVTQLMNPPTDPKINSRSSSYGRADYVYVPSNKKPELFGSCWQINRRGNEAVFYRRHCGLFDLVWCLVKKKTRLTDVHH